MAMFKSISSIIKPNTCIKRFALKQRFLSLVYHTVPKVRTNLKIACFVDKFNSLSQRVCLELENFDHDIKVYEVDRSEEMLNETILNDADLIICPFLTKRVPKKVWKSKPCFIVHPGIEGDRGMNSIDWAIQQKRKEWGVTVLQAADEMDMGDIWSTINFPIKRENMNSLTKSSMYTNEITKAAVAAVLEAVDKFKKQENPRPLNYQDARVKGSLQDKMTRQIRGVNWECSADDVANLVRMSDSSPGALVHLNLPCGEVIEDFRAFGVHFEHSVISYPLNKPGDIVGKRDGAILVKCGKGLVWLSHLKKNKLKLPSTLHLKRQLEDLHPIIAPRLEVPYGTSPITYQEIWTSVSPQGVAYLGFQFYNGAMSTDQCKRLVMALNELKYDSRVRVIVLCGGYNFFSNGIHLNVIENADDPALESWYNINAINDVVKAIFEMPKTTISALQGNAGAGGCMMALASDMTWAQNGVVLSPSYKAMNLYGSEYHTYFLPQRIGETKASGLTHKTEPLLAQQALGIGMIDDVMGDTNQEFMLMVKEKATRIAVDGYTKRKINLEQLAKCRQSELQIMANNFKDQSYHNARKAFVYH